MHPPLRPPTRSPHRPTARGALALLAAVLLGACSAADAAPDPRAWARAPRAQVTPERLLSVAEGFQSVEDVTPDGTAIIVSGGRMGRLGRVELATGDTSWLTSADAPYEPTWVLEAVAHPDGRQVAYHEYTNATNEWRPKVWRPEGPPLTPTDVESYWNAPVAWSPDGRRLLTHTGAASARLYAYDLAAGADPVPLISAGEISSVGFRPDGDWIVYTRRIAPDEEARAAYLLTSDGSREVRFEGLPEGAEVVGWSPDGAMVLYETGGESPSLWRQAVQDTRAVGMPVLVQWDRWGMSSIGVDGTGAYTYAVDTSRRDVLTVALGPDGLPTGVPTRRSAGVDGMRLEYAPDGASLLYLRNVEEGAAGRRLVVESRATGSSRTLDLGVPIRYISWARWMADGNGLVVKVVDDRDRYAFYRYDLASAAVDTLRVWNGPGVVGLHEPTPDGRGVVFGFREADAGPWRMDYLDLSTREERTLAVLALPQSEGRPGWMELSPDGSLLAFAMVGSIRLLDLATGDVRLALKAPVSWRTRPAWHPDGRHLYFATDSRHDETGVPVPSTLHRADLETGEVVDLGIEADVFDVVDVHPEGVELSYGAVTHGPTEIWRIRDVFDAPAAASDDGGAADRGAGR